MQKILNFVGGEFVPAQQEKFLDNYNPATGQVYSQLPDSNAVDMVMAIRSAHQAYEKWSKVSAQERCGILLKIAELMERDQEKLAKAESIDMGKPYQIALTADLPRAINNFKYFANMVLQQTELSSQRDSRGMNYALRQPVGVTGLISPWNFPLYLLTWKIAPALAVGNTAVCKPSELSPMTAFLLAEIMNEAGLPPGVCNIIFGKGDTAGEALVQHPGVPLISFTGGTATGQKILENSAMHFKKTSLELGGKNANIVFKDADLRKAIPMSLRAAFVNSGQVCLSGSRLFVQQDIYDDFLEKFVEGARQITVGDPADSKTYMGPVVSKPHLEKVKAAVSQAVDEKGKVLTGNEELTLTSEFSEGYFMRPTVIEDLTDCSDLWQTEIFGPVVTVRPFKYAHEAVKWANTSPYGLGASLWTKDLSRAHKTAAQIEAGTVWINTWAQRDVRAPFGGVKASGLGREGGEYSLDFYAEQKNICVEF